MNPKVKQVLLTSSSCLLSVLVYSLLFGPGAAAGPGSCVRGDVNDDGFIDVSDPILLLAHIFDGAPLAPDCPSGPLLATGQTTCESNDNEILCGDQNFPGQDGDYQAGIPIAGRFVDNGDGTVSDTVTGLMWQSGEAFAPLTWEQALVYCDDLGVASHTDWRLPNVRELHSLMDFGGEAPSFGLDPVFSGPSSSFWSSTRLINSSHDAAMNVLFTHGRIDWSLKTQLRGVRAVRDIP